VLNDSKLGGTSDDEITLFDGTSVGLQDLTLASAAIELAQAKNLVTYINL